MMNMMVIFEYTLSSFHLHANKKRQMALRIHSCGMGEKEAESP